MLFGVLQSNTVMRCHETLKSLFSFRSFSFKVSDLKFTILTQVSKVQREALIIAVAQFLWRVLELANCLL